MNNHISHHVLHHFSTLMPGVFKGMDTWRDSLNPPWLFLNARQCSQWFSEYIKQNITHQSRIKLNSPMYSWLEQVAPLYCVIGAWRIGRSVIRCDPDFFAALGKTPLSGNIPVQILYRLPFWGVYIELPGVRISDSASHDESIHGAFFSLFENTDGEILLLALVIMEGFSSNVNAEPENGSKLYKEFGLPLNGNIEKSIIAMKKEEQNFWSLSLSVLLYLCSENPDWGNTTPHLSEPKLVKGRPRYFATDKPVIWDVGVRIGAALRLQLSQIANDSITHGAGSNEKRPHIRRAHWHGYWKGKKKSNGCEILPLSERQYELRWLPPITVKFTSSDELPVTIRKLK